LIGRALAAHPGDVTVQFEIRTASGMAVKLAAADEWNVEECDSLRDELEPWLA
jgi:hypothetical protein